MVFELYESWWLWPLTLKWHRKLPLLMEFVHRIWTLYRICRSSAKWAHKAITNATRIGYTYWIDISTFTRPRPITICGAEGQYFHQVSKLYGKVFHLWENAQYLENHATSVYRQLDTIDELWIMHVCGLSAINSSNSRGLNSVFTQT